MNIDLPFPPLNEIQWMESNRFAVDTFSSSHAYEISFPSLHPWTNPTELMASSHFNDQCNSGFSQGRVPEEWTVGTGVKEKKRKKEKARVKLALESCWRDWISKEKSWSSILIHLVYIVMAWQHYLLFQDLNRKTFYIL